MSEQHGAAPLLLVDIGNTRLKWRWVPRLPEQVGVLPTDGVLPLGQVNTATLQEQFAAGRGGARGPGLALISCVAEESIAEVALHAAQSFGLRTHRVRTVATAAGVTNGYAQPERLGVDRWLGLIAAHELRALEMDVHGPAAGPLVVAGVGTALTLDVLAADGTHRGGLLVPGPALMEDTLLQRTARIAASAGQDEPLVHEGLGRNTRGALQAGAWLAAAAVTERVAREASATRLVLTGGGAEGVATRLEPGLAEHVAADVAPNLGLVVVPDLVLRGLQRIARGLLHGEADCGMMTA